MIDSHCHLEFPEFDEDREEVIERSQQELLAIIDSSPDFEKSDRVLELHEENSGFLYPCLGLHPTSAIELSHEGIEEYKEKIRHQRKNLVAVGEVGLDYYHVDERNRKRSKEIFREFLELSDELDLPLVVHSRQSMKDTLDILNEKKGGKAIIHCFSGEKDDLEESVDRDYYLSFGGIIFRMPEKYEKLLERVPLENLLLETDAPFLGKMKSDRSEPSFIREVAKKIAKIKDLEFSEVWKAAGKNAISAFDLPVEL
ncbi:MAG: TatD family hydrolase [Candidatus Hadarchaeota archaeon]